MFSLKRIAAVVLLAAVPGFAQQHKITDAEIAKITREAILIDTHDDVTSKTVTGYDIAQLSNGGQTDLPRDEGLPGSAE